MGFVLAAPARAAETAVIVVDDLDLERYGERGAVGLMVPGAGSKVSGRGARAALVRGEVETALTGGVPEGDPRIALATRPAGPRLSRLWAAATAVCSSRPRHVSRD